MTDLEEEYRKWKKEKNTRVSFTGHRYVCPDEMGDRVILSTTTYNQLVRSINLLISAIIPLLPDDGIKDKLCRTPVLEIIEDD